MAWRPLHASTRSVGLGPSLRKVSNVPGTELLLTNAAGVDRNSMLAVKLASGNGYC